ncbi:MAG: tRNA epoxyqueuosine(34) reductase QueG [Rhodospirillales bacterium]
MADYTPETAETAKAAKAEIRRLAAEAGFDACGFTAAEVDAKTQAALANFLNQGRHGTMDWMARNADRRADPQVLWPEARTVIALAMSYAPGRDPLAAHSRPSRGAVSVYAQGRDYHDVMKPRLKRLARAIAEAWDAEVKVFVDTAPVMEKPLAENAGLGWRGKHTNLVSRAHGSWLFLGEIFTTLALPPDAPEIDHCGACDACLRACPTGAFPAPYELDARACVSYLTIEHKGAIAPDLMARMGARIYGCDDCLAVCPWNKFEGEPRHAEFAPRAELAAPSLRDLAALDDAAFREVFAGSPVKRTGRDAFVRNVLIAIGNSGDASLRGVCENLTHDPAPVVAETARWALERLGP